LAYTVIHFRLKLREFLRFPFNRNFVWIWYSKLSVAKNPGINTRSFGRTKKISLQNEQLWSKNTKLRYSKTRSFGKETRSFGSKNLKFRFDKPEVSVQKPEVLVRKSEVSVRKPEVSVQKPEVSVQKPEVSVQKPEVSKFVFRNVSVEKTWNFELLCRMGKRKFCSVNFNVEQIIYWHLCWVIWDQEPNCILKILKFDISWVISLQIPI
jgi:hypothetical protein